MAVGVFRHGGPIGYAAAVNAGTIQSATGGRAIGTAPGPGAGADAASEQGASPIARLLAAVRATLAWIGAGTLEELRYLCLVAATVAVCWGRALLPSTWRPISMRATSVQFLSIGVEGSRFIAIVALVTGLAVVLQTQLWLTRLGQTGLLGPILVLVVVRELAPIVTAFILVGRSGAAIVTDLGTRAQRGEVHALDAQGIDPFVYYVVPRVLAMTVAGFVLSVLFIFVTIVSGYLAGRFLDVARLDVLSFIDSVAGQLQPSDALNLLVKSVLTAAATGAIACAEGLSVRPESRGAGRENDSTGSGGLSRAVQRCYSRSIITLCVVIGVTSIATYV